MRQALADCVIGIDGGGTQCRFALQSRARRVDWCGPSANASTDLDASRQVLRTGLAHLAERAGLELADLSEVPTVAGLAGVISSTIAAELAQDLPVTKLHIEDDRRTAMVGALGGGDGLVVGIGTGTFFGRRCDGVDRLVDGWGLVLADEASGADLGRKLLRAVLAVADGLADPSPMSARTLDRFAGPAGIVRFAADASPASFSALAPDIVAAAQAGDGLALRLMREGAQFVDRRVRQLGWTQGERICLVGGLAPHYAPFLSPDLAKDVTPPDGSALEGALRLARQMAQMERSDDGC